MRGEAVAKANQTFFIPECIRRLRLSGLPQFPELASVLRRLNASTLDDLSGISLRDFQRVSANGTALFLEVGRLVERARRGDFAVSFKQSMRLRPVSSRRVPARRSAVKEMGPPHDKAFSEIRGYRNCGTKTLNELRELVRAIQHSHQTPSAEGQVDLVVNEAPPPVAAGAIFVPITLHKLIVDDLPLSVRLVGVLQRKGVRRLGDVHGVPIPDLRRVKNCGRKTISELVRLIERAAAGEFSAAPDVASNPAELVRTLDALIADLPDRNEEIFIPRLGGRSEELPKLDEVGAKYCLTRERVRQIVDLALERIRKRGGPRLRNHVNHVEKVCREKVLPLTPALLTQWLEGSQAAVSFNPAFYVRLLAELKPTIPAWPAGQHSDPLDPLSTEPFYCDPRQATVYQRPKDVEAGIYWINTARPLAEKIRNEYTADSARWREYLFQRYTEIILKEAIF